MSTSGLCLDARRICDWQSFPAGQQVDDPAAANVLAGLPAMIQNVGVGAAGVFEGVGEDGEAVEGTVGVDGFGELRDGGGEPRAIEVDGAEGVADNFSQ